MPTKRKRKGRGLASRITPEAIAAWSAGDSVALKRALRLPPWQLSPLDAVGDCPWHGLTAGATTWPDSVALREELSRRAD